MQETLQCSAAFSLVSFKRDREQLETAISISTNKNCREEQTQAVGLPVCPAPEYKELVIAIEASVRFNHSMRLEALLRSIKYHVSQGNISIQIGTVGACRIMSAYLDIFGMSMHVHDRAAMCLSQILGQRKKYEKVIKLRNGGWKTEALAESARLRQEVQVLEEAKKAKDQPLPQFLLSLNHL